MIYLFISTIKNTAVCCIFFIQSYCFAFCTTQYTPLVSEDISKTHKFQMWHQISFGSDSAVYYVCMTLYVVLEIKPCGLGSRIWDMEADLIFWWSFWTSMEAFRGQTPYSDRTLWHFNSMFGPSHSAKVCGRCMVCGL